MFNNSKTSFHSSKSKLISSSTQNLNSRGLSLPKSYGNLYEKYHNTNDNHPLRNPINT